ncbi:hypothetical protein AX15_000447 [Amanita polypyramis BW_CC]|nr:hypothetical protein AX15_000447 [Amanita polypyramis BW_CC]
MSKLTDHKVLVLDVYGTLIDWESGLFDALQPLLVRYPASASWGREEALRTFSSIEMDLQDQYPDMLYSDLLANVHKAIEKRLKVLSDEDDAGELDASPIATTDNVITSAYGTSDDPHTTFAKAIRDWRAFPDSCAALHGLQDRFKLVVLSNVDYNSFKYAHARLSEGNDVVLTPRVLDLYSYPENNPNRHWFPLSAPDDNKSPFTLVLTAQDVKAYKPSPVGLHTVLQCVCSDPRLLGEEGKSPDEVKGKVLVVAQSLPHDHEMAGALGVQSVWIDRQGAVTCTDIPEGTEQKWTWRFETLAQLAEAVEKELRH